MNRLILVFTILFISNSAIADNTKKVLCELEGNYSITYEDFRRNYFNEAVEKADIIVFLVAHKEFSNLNLKNDKIILDYCGVLTDNDK